MDMKTEPNDLARPHSVPKRAENGVVVEYDQHFGLTKREHIAIEMTKALLTRDDWSSKEVLTKEGISIADELIKQLNA